MGKIPRVWGHENFLGFNGPNYGMTDREEYREALVEAFRVVAAKTVTRLNP